MTYYFVNKKEENSLSGELKTKEELIGFLSRETTQVLIENYRAGQKEAKGLLPAILFQGHPMKQIGEPRSRLKENMVSNRKYLIDLDHIEPVEGAEWTPKKVWDMITAFNDFDAWKIQMAFITPSGKGLKLVAEMMNAEDDILDHQRRLVDHFVLGRWYDEVNIDYSRLSFCPQWSEVLYLSDDLFALSEENTQLLQSSIEHFGEGKEKEQSPTAANRASTNPEDFESYENFQFRGRRLKPIVEEWTIYRGEQLGIVVNGKPFQSEVHSLHYNILRDIRNMCDNNPAVMTAMVPTFGHSTTEIFNQAKKILSYHTNGRFPTMLWAWMKDRGYLEQPGEGNEDELEDEELKSPYSELLSTMPELPPIIRDWVRVAPYEFKIPTIAALLEILGTLTTYAEAEYFDGAMHTSTFFSVIWAEAAGGKSFVKKFLYLHDRMRNREEIINARERLYDAFVSSKSDNKDAPERPLLCKRILEPKFSEVQLFTQCFENKGVHLHTYCPEIDTLGRGVRGLSDLLRIAWDNDATGQQFRSSQTFKGSVKLYWNLLVTGTPERVMAFFSDVLDGLVTRITIMPIFNTEFAPFRPWKSIPSRTIDYHYKLIQQFDDLTYEDPVEMLTPEMLSQYRDLSTFDKNVSWNFKVRPRISRDLSFTWKPLLKWCEQIRKSSSKDVNNAVFTFSKRSANKGFHAALVANELWGNPNTEKAKKKIVDFCLWWTKVEHFGSCYVFADEYNKRKRELRDRMSNMKAVKYGNVFDSLENEFTKGDLIVAAKRQHNSTDIRQIVYVWKTEGLITKLDKNKWKKI